MQTIVLLFLITVPGGALLFTLFWLPTRGLASRSGVWRLILSGLVAFGIAPSVVTICGRDFIVPASYASLYILSPDDVRRWIGLVHGLLPLIAFAAILFCAWSYYVKIKKEVHPVAPDRS